MLSILDPNLTPRPINHNPFDRQHPLLSPNKLDQTTTLTPTERSSHISASAAFISALPTTGLSLHAPVFPTKRTKSMQQEHLTAGTPNHPSPSSKGQIHIKLIQAKGLSITAPSARPYVVVQFEQNEFVSSGPVDDQLPPLSPKPALPRVGSSNAIEALGAVAAAMDAKKRKSSGGSSNGSKPPSPTSPTFASRKASNGSIFGRVPHSPVWKHDVSFDVTSSTSTITLNVYDRSCHNSEQGGFLGTVQIRPVLKHDHTVDQWYKLKPCENEPVSGEIRVQCTFEQYKTKHALTPRSFEFLKLIGRGTFGKVFQVRKKDTKRIYAMKILSKKEIVAKEEVAHTIGERKILAISLECPFLVGLKFSFQTETDLYLVTDFKSGGELFWHLQRETRFHEDRAKFYVAELILALEHLHKYDIVYRDLKPENILLDATGHISLCDFGLSKPDLTANSLTTTFCGTTEYLAPEILLDVDGYSKLVDFWSLGVLLFEMCCGWSPFYAEDTQKIYKNICFGKIRFPKGVICEEGKLFVKGLLNRNPRHRLGAERDAAELKEHAFFKGLDWHALSLKQITPPFRPNVESDESTACFDPEFTNADVNDVGGWALWGDESDDDEGWLDEEDPSENWVEHTLAGSVITHTPNGPLGSDRPPSANGKRSRSVSPGVGNSSVAPLSAVSTNGDSTTNDVPESDDTKPKGIKIKSKPKKEEAASSLLSHSVQEKFKGFTFSGGESVIAPGGVLDRRAAENAVRTGRDGDATSEPTTEDEFEDFGKGAGRYAKRKGMGFTELDE